MSLLARQMTQQILHQMQTNPMHPLLLLQLQLIKWCADFLQVPPFGNKNLFECIIAHSAVLLASAQQYACLYMHPGYLQISFTSQSPPATTLS